MKDGKKMKMKEGDCMDMDGKMDKCSMMTKSKKMKTKKHSMAMSYTCPMHSEVTSDKPGKCPKCGMDLVEKNKLKVHLITMTNSEIGCLSLFIKKILLLHS